jgi:RimJ/RimL family protein N-acetyltransferase
VSSDPRPRSRADRIELVGPRFLLRTLRAGDETPAYLAWLRDPEVTRFLELRFEDMDAAKLRAWIETFDDVHKYLFGIHDRETGAFIGTATLYDIRPHHGLANYGYLVGEKAYWGRGVATEVVRLLFDFAFDVVGVRKISTGCLAPNLASVVNYKRLGLRTEGTLKAHRRWGDGYCDEYIYSITADEWRARREARA